MFPCNPRPHPANVMVHGKVRVTLLTDRMVRMEYAADGVFEDRATLAVVNRSMPKVAHATKVRGDRLTVDTGAMRIESDGTGPFTKKNLSVVFKHLGKRVAWTPGKRNPGNLGGTLRTLDVMEGGDQVRYVDGKAVDWKKVKHPDGLVSRDGWAVVDESTAVVLEEGITGDDRRWPVSRPAGKRQDLYLLAYGDDYAAALRDAAGIFGRQPLPPRYAFGYWYSKYWAYTDKEIEELVGQFDRMDVPLDLMVIDMDWHKIGWTGYSWCAAAFPDPQGHLKWLKDRDLKISLNLHPAGGVGEHEDCFGAMVKHLGRQKVEALKAEHGLRDDTRRLYLKFYGKSAKDYDYVPFDIADPDYMRAYFEVLHRPMEADGVDVWWMDWQQGATSKIPGLDTLPWINHLHWEDQERNPDRAGQRPLCFSRFGGLGAGRYPIGFSGDTWITWKSLAYQPWFTATASNVLYGYWSHDIGGHMGSGNTPEIYTRWLQFGIHSPILRTHASKDRHSDRRVFEYAEPYKSIMMGCIRRRYELVPYIYGACRDGVESGLSLVRPMYYGWPKETEAYTATGQYQFGDDLIVAPVCREVDLKDGMAPVKVWLPKGTWFDTAHGSMLKGGRWHERRYLLEETPVFARAGAVIPGQQAVNRLMPGSYRDLVVTVYPGADGHGDLYEDDGVSTDYLEGASVRIPITCTAMKTGRTIKVGKVKARFEGFLAKRTFELRLPGSVPPMAVKVDGEALPWRADLAKRGWTYDGDTATTIVRLRQVDVTRGRTITIVDSPTPAKRVDGLAGLMRRLVKIGREVALVSPWRTQFIDERFAVRVSQTGNRITRRPETTAREVAALRRDLAKLPDNLATYVKLYRRWQKQTRSEAIDTLKGAQRLVASTLAQFG